MTYFLTVFIFLFVFHYSLFGQSDDEVIIIDDDEVMSGGFLDFEPPDSAKWHLPIWYEPEQQKTDDERSLEVNETTSSSRVKKESEQIYEVFENSEPKSAESSELELESEFEEILFGSPNNQSSSPSFDPQNEPSKAFEAEISFDDRKKKTGHKPKLSIQNFALNEIKDLVPMTTTVMVQDIAENYNNNQDKDVVETFEDYQGRIQQNILATIGKTLRHSINV